MFGLQTGYNERNPNVRLSYVSIVLHWGNSGFTQGLLRGYIGDTYGLHWGNRKLETGYKPTQTFRYVWVTNMLQTNVTQTYGCLTLHLCYIGVTQGLHSVTQTFGLQTLWWTKGDYLHLMTKGGHFAPDDHGMTFGPF